MPDSIVSPERITTINHVTASNSDNISEATRRLLRSACIAPAGSDLEEDLALRTPALLRAVDNRWGVLASGPVDTEHMKQALSRLAIEILRRDDTVVPLDWIQSRLLRGVRAKEKFRAVVGGVKQLFRQHPQAMQDVQEGFQQADSLSVQLVQAAQSHGILKLVGAPSAGAPTNPRVSFSHDTLLYAFGALHELSPGLLWTGVDDSGETPEGRRLYLAKLSLLNVDDLAKGLSRVAEKNLDVVTAFVLHDTEAMRREGEGVAEKYFQRIDWETWRADVEAAQSRLDPFGHIGAQAARAWTREVLEESDAGLSGYTQSLAGLPLGLGILSCHGRAQDLDLLRRVEHQAPRLGDQHLTQRRRDLELADKYLARRASSQEKAKRTAKKVAASLLTAGGGAALGADYRREEWEARQEALELSGEIDALESQLDEFRQHVATLARDAIEAIKRRAR